jgi:hypothetical protein
MAVYDPEFLSCSYSRSKIFSIKSKIDGSVDLLFFLADLTAHFVYSAHFDKASYWDKYVR